MSTDTRRQEDEKTAKLARLAVLFASVVDLIQRQRRSTASIDVLIYALQLFKEHRLAGVLAKAPEGAEDAALLSPILSLRIENTPMPRHAKREFGQRGLRYIGEVYYHWKFTHGYHERLKRQREIRDCLIEDLGLPLELDPIKIGWRPPYWDDAYFVAALNKPTIEVLGHHGRYMSRYHQRGFHYFGQVLKEIQEKGRRSLDVESDLSHHRGKLHSAMLVPADWCPPVGVPKQWTRWMLSEETRAQGEPSGRLAVLRRHARTAGEETVVEWFFEWYAGHDGERVFASGIRSFRVLVLLQLDEVSRRLAQLDIERCPDRIDQDPLTRIEKALADYGLRFGMSETELRDAFDAQSDA